MAITHTPVSLTSFAADPNANRPVGYPTTWLTYQRATAKCAECYAKIVKPGVECTSCQRHMCEDCFDNGKTAIGLWRNIEGCWCQFGARPAHPQYAQLREEWQRLANTIQTMRGFDPEAPPPQTKSAKKRTTAKRNDDDLDTTPTKRSKITKTAEVTAKTKGATKTSKAAPVETQPEGTATSMPSAFDEFRGVRIPALQTSEVTRARGLTGARAYIQNLFDWEDEVTEARAVHAVGTTARDGSVSPRTRVLNAEHNDFWDGLQQAQIDELEKQEQKQTGEATQN